MSDPPETKPALVEARALVVGAGGIGCPALWGLVNSGFSSVRIVDPDVVELSNLPRQVLFTPADVGRPKAKVAAKRFARAITSVEPVRARLDDKNAERVLRDVDVVIDATDGATTKDWINQLCVRRGLPLVHAAGLRSEARLLAIPAGGKPCLACLFGRLEEETGSCADLGVWNGVVGVVGFLAAEAAVTLLAKGDPGERSYIVLDFDARRSLALAVEPDAACPVCAREAAAEAYPEPADCAAAPLHPEVEASSLDLREERCPMNLLRARRALADMEAGAVLEIDLGKEGAETVPDGVRALGHTVLAQEPRARGLWLRVRAGRTAASSDMSDEDLRRFARQIVLPEVGEAGQRRLHTASVLFDNVLGSEAEVAAHYLAAAGVGRIGVGWPTPMYAPSGVEEIAAFAHGTVEAVHDVDADGYDWVVTSSGDGPRFEKARDLALSIGAGLVRLPPRGHADVLHSFTRELAAGAMLADMVQRAIVSGEVDAFVLPSQRNYMPGRLP